MSSPDRHLSQGRWARLRHSLSAKLIVLVTTALVVIFGLFGYLIIRLQRQQLDAAALASADQVSDVIKRSTYHYMLENDRQGLFYLIETMAGEPGVVKIRIFNPEGRISYSTDRQEINTVVNTTLNRPDRLRFYRTDTGERVLGIIHPVENAPACSNASCHAHPASQQILGLLDTDLSLSRSDASLAKSNRGMIIYMVLAVVMIAALTGVFVWRVVYGPLEMLEQGTERLASGELGYQIEVSSRDELGELAASFNTMSSELRDARKQIEAATDKLEERVEQKTRELSRAHEEMLRVEKMASIGKLAAVVAHGINNPLAGILTYAKLLKKQFQRENGAKQAETLSSLDLIERESRRCGGILKNLMTFARTTPLNYEPADLNAVIHRCIRLVQHHIQLAGVELHTDFAVGLPPVKCDAAQIEQVIISLIMNAIDAMPGGGNLALRTRQLPDSKEMQIQVQDNGTGISKEVLSHLFEPFFTTKERGHGLGLGLAISRNIIEGHQGKIQVASEPGRGTLFVITLPVNGVPVAPSEEPRVAV